MILYPYYSQPLSILLFDCLFLCALQRWQLIVLYTYCVLNNPFPLHWSDGMRCCRSDWPGLCLFCCYQLLCIVSQQSWLGVFFLCHKFSNSTPPPQQDAGPSSDGSCPPVRVSSESTLVSEARSSELRRLTRYNPSISLLTPRPHPRAGCWSSVLMAALSACTWLPAA